MTLRIVFFWYALSVLLVAQPLASPPTAEAWRSDLDEIVRDIRTFHPDPFAKTGQLAFVRAVAALKADLPELSEEQRVVRAMRLVARIGDGHTQLEPTSDRFASWYPIRVYEFSDGYFVTSAHKSVADLAGAQVLQIRGRPVQEVVEQARDLMGDENRYDRKERLFPLMNAGMMKGLGFADADGALSLRVRLRSGKKVDRTLLPRVANSPDYHGSASGFEWQFRGEMFGVPIDTPADWTSAYKGLTAEAFRTVDYARPPYMYQRRAYVSHAIPEKKAYYVQLNQVDSTRLVAFIKSAVQEIDVEKPQRLIIDLRYNFGGDGSKVVDMIHEFIKREDHAPWKELYILTGRKTFSAGVMVLDQFIKHTDATLIGEPAGAALNHFGDATTHKYTRTGLSLNVSTLRHQLGESSDIREFVGVDVPASFSFNDYVNGRDPAVDAILRGDEMRGIVQIALTAGGAAARKAYLIRKQRFAGDPSWVAPPEVELRNACNRLQDEKRVEDAVETCRLSTQIHPDVWNSWYSLGSVLTAAGRRQESVENYACVLKIDPLNWNQREINKILAEFHANPDKVPEGCGSAVRR